MDNASIHTADEIKELTQNCGFLCVYLPPYSPFLNPIEEIGQTRAYDINLTS
jgi:transposase